MQSDVGPPELLVFALSDIDQRFALRASKVRPRVCVVSHGEVRVLAGGNGWGEPKLAALQKAPDSLVSVDISHANVLDAYVEIDLYSQQHTDGARNMGKNDLWIAASAKTTGATLLTTDKDFDPLDGALLSVEYVDPESGKSS